MSPIITLNKTFRRFLFITSALSFLWFAASYHEQNKRIQKLSKALHNKVTVKEIDPAAFKPRHGSLRKRFTDFRTKSHTEIEQEIMERDYLYAPIHHDIAQNFNRYDFKLGNWAAWNEAAIAELAGCTAAETCGPNQQKVIIMATWWCSQGFLQNFRGGEGLWCNSVVESLQRQGYTFFFTHQDEAMAHRLYNLFPDMVKVVFTEGIVYKQYNSEYVKTPERPDGIPLWKMFHFSYWPSCGQNPIGCEWTVSAEVDMEENKRNYTYLGYAVNCSQSRFVPWEEREDRAWVFAKELRYFYQDDVAFPVSFVPQAKAEILEKYQKDVKFVGGFKDNRFDEERAAKPLEDPPQVENYGKMAQAEFRERMGGSKLLLGIRNPLLSPSPYEALCLGVPFLNPVEEWDHDHPDDRKRWRAQQQTLTTLDKPYVYHVKKNNYDEYVAAIKEAMENPIPSFKFDYMTEDELDKRVKYIMETDWYSIAKERLERRQAGLEGGELYPM